MHRIYCLFALHLILTRSFSFFYRRNNYMLVFSRTWFFTVKASGRRKQGAAVSGAPAARRPPQPFPGKAGKNPLLWLGLPLPPTPHHCNHPASPQHIQGREVTRGHCLTGTEMRFMVLSCFFNCGKGKSITLTRKRRKGCSLPAGAEKWPTAKAQLEFFSAPGAEAGLAWHGGPPDLLSRIWKLKIVNTFIALVWTICALQYTC